MIKFIPIPFFIGVFIGFFIIYSLASPQIILKQPNTQNHKNILYIDDNNVCYKYNKIKVPCPK